MQLVSKTGYCAECGSNTNIQLDCGIYACLNCLNRLGRETQNVREYIEQPKFACFWYSTPEKCDGLIGFLSACKDNNIMSVDNIIKTLNAIKIQFQYKNGVLDKKESIKIEKNLDIFKIL